MGDLAGLLLVAPRVALFAAAVLAGVGAWLLAGVFMAAKLDALWDLLVVAPWSR